jgi:hypothetical protein
MLFYAWTASGADPYRLYNRLDERYRPLGHPDEPPRPPPFPERVQAFIYAMGRHYRELQRKEQGELAMAIGQVVAKAIPR